MAARRRAAGAPDAQAVLKPELGYRWSEPPAPSSSEHGPFWTTDLSDPVAEMTEQLVAAEWRTADLRDRIEKLGGEAKGRTRRDLAERLAGLFLDPARLARAVAGLSDEERHFYLQVLIRTQLHGYYATSDSGARPRSGDRSALRAGILKAGLALVGEDGSLVIPFGIYQRLPALHVPCVQAPEPKQVVSAADPREVLSQIQQLLGLLQSEKSTLRARPYWQAPEYPYARTVTCWPPMPEDAAAIRQYPDRQRTLELWPPEPHLDQPSLEAWSKALGISEEWAEFLYHVLVASGIVLPGSPLTVNHELIQTWLALPSGQQLGTVYRLYRNITHWATWWPLWRSGEVRVRRAYQGYWGLMSIDESVHLSCTNLRWILLELLSFLPHEQWLALADIQRWFGELFPKPETHRYMMGLQLEHTRGAWLGFLDAAVHKVIVGPLHAMGFVDVAPSLEHAAFVRLRNLQDLHWGRANGIVLEAMGQLRRDAVRYRPDLPGLELETPVPPDFITFLLQWAKPAGLSRNLVRYELDASRLHRTFEHGANPDTLEAGWKASASFAAIPEIATWWRYWWSRYGRVRLYPDQTILQTRDDFTMHELQMSLADLQGSILGLVTPRAAMLKPEDADRIVSDLTRQGYMPKEIS